MMKKYNCSIADKGVLFKKSEPGFVYILNDCVVVTKVLKDTTEKLRKTGPLNEAESSNKNGNILKSSLVTDIHSKFIYYLLNLLITY
jgi:hypothetical protein